MLAPELPRDAAQSRLAMDREFADARKLFMANRGLWDAVASAGPGCSFSMARRRSISISRSRRNFSRRRSNSAFALPELLEGFLGQKPGQSTGGKAAREACRLTGPERREIIGFQRLRLGTQGCQSVTGQWEGG